MNIVVPLLVSLIWDIFVLGGTSYLVFFHEPAASAWWYLLAVIVLWFPYGKDE